MNKPLRVGAVIYDPKVTVIWGIISDFFKDEGAPTECAYFEDYAQQVDALLEGDIDIAWNSPLAWLDAYLRSDGGCLNGAMRDTDRDRKSCFLVRKDSGFAGLADLRGATIGFGATDSPQARLIPISHLHKQGLEYEKDYVERRFNKGEGLHGDHVGGELDAVKALAAEEVDATVALDFNWASWQKDGTVDASQLICLATTELFDHCIFSGRPDLEPERFDAWLEVLQRMDYSNPQHRTMMDMEGLKAWVPGRTSGFKEIQDANAYLGFFKAG
ncbi:MAG: PhnD/SsuA/transferrin family substrate-binding protein [Coriobacteriales bacterium]|jgi:ABC-type phosphate/phosphonate transport system substrate-binding protein|nr:PhnD/SsuA/transferrin family substrate-binding protein [Coriobacteriales bacterium]